MATKISLELPDNLYQKVQDFARLHQQTLEEAISMILEERLIADAAVREFLDGSEPDPAVDREMKAYSALYPSLKERLFGKHVAIYQGELIDYDDDPAALDARIDERYPDEFVLLTQIKPEPIETFVVRSPRIEWE